MPHLAGWLPQPLAFVSPIRSMVFHASAGGCAFPGGRVKNRAALLSPEPETSSRSLNKATPPTVADQTGRSPPTTPKTPPALLLPFLFESLWKIGLAIIRKPPSFKKGKIFTCTSIYLSCVIWARTQVQRKLEGAKREHPISFGTSMLKNHQ